MPIVNILKLLSNNTMSLNLSAHCQQCFLASYYYPSRRNKILALETPLGGGAERGPEGDNTWVLGNPQLTILWVIVMF